MDTIRLKNLRALADTNEVRIAPITVLLGANSSGKSTFLRTFPLFRQSTELETTAPILWYGNLVDFGSFNESRASFAGRSPIEIELTAPIERIALGSLRTVSGFRYRDQYLSPDATGPCVARVNILDDSETSAGSFVSSLVIEVLGHSIEIGCERDGRISSLSINGNEISSDLRRVLRVFQGSLLPRLAIVARRPEDNSEVDLSLPFQVSGVLLEEARRVCAHLFHGNTKRQTIEHVLRKVSLDTTPKMLATLASVESLKPRNRELLSGNTFTEVAAGVEISHLVLRILPSLLSDLSQYYRAFAQNVHYAKPVRATAERYYRIQDLSISSLDPEGRNVATFLRSLSIAEQNDFSSWTRELMGWSVRSVTTSGHSSLLIDEQRGKQFNLSDTGFGYSQLLPIIAYLWRLQRGRQPFTRAIPVTFAIEQPELHLHPRMQAQMTNAFVKASAAARRLGVDLRLMIETHSETLVNFLGKAIANKELPAEDVSILVFESNEAGRSSVQNARFDSAGVLLNWPYGFFEP